MVLVIFITHKGPFTPGPDHGIDAATVITIRPLIAPIILAVITDIAWSGWMDFMSWDVTNVMVWCPVILPSLIVIVFIEHPSFTLRIQQAWRALD